ncbi:MAG: hypothetical protein IKZ49_00765 [Alphaproteobacteria bacterium]|nr:hypothetical protein [Alphaproteobacteria bacterium]
MKIIRFFKRLFICILCIGCLYNSAFAAGNLPHGDIGLYGNWLTDYNLGIYNKTISSDMKSFENTFETNLSKSDFVPIEVKIGLSFIKALSSLDSVLQISLVRFTIIFLLIMYAFWVGLEAYKMIRESTDYKSVLYDIFKKGMIVSIWIAILIYGPARIFVLLINPIMALAVYISDFILDTVANLYNIEIPDTCATIQNYIAANTSGPLLSGDEENLLMETTGNIMCLPARLSVYFYHAIKLSFHWIINGIGHSATAVALGIVSLFVFIKAIFKYAFMTLGVTADLFLRLLMLPFTALAESMPATKEKNYVAKIYTGLLELFNTKKASDVLNVFINVAIYFVSLSIIIAICAILLSNVIHSTPDSTFVLNSAMTTLLCGCLTLHLVNRSDELAKKIGGEVNNSLGEDFQKSTKKVWGNTKAMAGKLFKEWLKK